MDIGKREVRRKRDGPREGDGVEDGEGQAGNCRSRSAGACSRFPAVRLDAPLLACQSHTLKTLLCVLDETDETIHMRQL